MGLGVTPTVYFKRQKKSEKNPSSKQLMDREMLHAAKRNSREHCDV